MSKDAISELAIAIRELTAELRVYNQRNEPAKPRPRGEAEFFKADPEAESRRELHDSLLDLEQRDAIRPRRRS